MPAPPPPVVPKQNSAAPTSNGGGGSTDPVSAVANASGAGNAINGFGQTVGNIAGIKTNPDDTKQIAPYLGAMTASVSDPGATKEQQLAAQYAAQVASGKGPSVAQQMLNQQMATAGAQNNAMASSGLGTSGNGLARRQAMMQNAGTAQALGAAGATARAQEQLGAIGELANTASQIRTSDVQQAGVYGQEAGLNLQAQGLGQAAQAQGFNQTMQGVQMGGGALAGAMMAFADGPVNMVDLEEPGGRSAVDGGPPRGWVMREMGDTILLFNKRTGRAMKMAMQPLSPEEHMEAFGPHGAGPLPVAQHAQHPQMVQHAGDLDSDDSAPIDFGGAQRYQGPAPEPQADMAGWSGSSAGAPPSGGLDSGEPVPSYQYGPTSEGLSAEAGAKGGEESGHSKFARILAGALGGIANPKRTMTGALQKMGQRATQKKQAAQSGLTANPTGQSQYVAGAPMPDDMATVGKGEGSDSDRESDYPNYPGLKNTGWDLSQKDQYTLPGGYQVLQKGDVDLEPSNSWDFAQAQPETAVPTDHPLAQHDQRRMGLGGPMQGGGSVQGYNPANLKSAVDFQKIPRMTPDFPDSRGAQRRADSGSHPVTQDELEHYNVFKAGGDYYPTPEEVGKESLSMREDFPYSGMGDIPGVDRLDPYGEKMERTTGMVDPTNPPPGVLSQMSGHVHSLENLPEPYLTLRDMGADVPYLGSGVQEAKEHSFAASAPSGTKAPKKADNKKEGPSALESAFKNRQQVRRDSIDAADKWEKDRAAQEERGVKLREKLKKEQLRRARTPAEKEKIKILSKYSGPYV